MQEQDNIRTIHKVYEAFGKGDVPGVLSMLADNVSWSTPGPRDIIPYAGLRTGHNEVAGYFESFGEAAQTTEFEPHNFLSEGDMVVVLGRYTFTVVKTGKVVNNDWVHAFTLEKGKVSIFEGYEDSAAVVEAFSAPPSSQG